MMPGELAHIARPQDLTETDIAQAVRTRAGTWALLGRLAAVSAPESGTAKVLLLLARMATTACEWLDGDLFIQLVDEGQATRVEVSTELGGGHRERVFTPFDLRAPLVEFSRAMDRVPQLVAPLAIRARAARRITFAASARVRRTSAPPPPIEISEKSLYVRAPAPALPKARGSMTYTSVEPLADLDAGWDD